jgi:hypothetical protein
MLDSLPRATIFFIGIVTCLELASVKNFMLGFFFTDSIPSNNAS